MGDLKNLVEIICRHAFLFLSDAFIIKLNIIFNFIFYF